MPKNKTELVSINKTKVKEAVNAFLEGVFTELNAWGRVAIKRLGSLHAQERQPKAGRNPKTGEAIDVTAKRAVKLWASKNFRQPGFHRGFWHKIILHPVFSGIIVWFKARAGLECEFESKKALVFTSTPYSW